MIYSKQECEEMFPGKWVNLSAEANSYYIVWGDDYGIWYNNGQMEIYDGKPFYKECSLKEARAYYKKHFLLANFI